MSLIVNYVGISLHRREGRGCEGLTIFMQSRVPLGPGKFHLVVLVIFQKRVRVFHRGFKHEKTDESTRPEAECFYCFRVFETPMKHETRAFEITSPTEKN